MPDSPMTAKCFSEEDKHLLIERVRTNQTGLQNKRFRREQMFEALLDPQTYCYMLIAICTTLPTGGLGAFANIIIKGFNFSVLQTQLLAMVLGVYIIIVLLSSTWLAKKTGQNLLVMGIYVIPSFVGTIVLMTVENKNKSTQVGLLVSCKIHDASTKIERLTRNRLYDPLFLVCPDFIYVLNFTKHCRPDEEEHCCSCELHWMGGGKFYW